MQGIGSSLNDAELSGGDQRISALRPTQTCCRQLPCKPFFHFRRIGGRVAQSILDALVVQDREVAEQYCLGGDGVLHGSHRHWAYQYRPASYSELCTSCWTLGVPSS